MNIKQKIVILPIKEPGASMIASGEKKMEFRNWIPKGQAGTQIGIVATGNAEKPRRVIARAIFGGTYIVNKLNEMGQFPEDMFLTKIPVGSYWTSEEIEQLTYKMVKVSYKGSYSNITDKQIKQGGGKFKDFALSILDVNKFKVPFTLESIGIESTPQKYQYFEFYAEPGQMPTGNGVNNER